MKKTIVFLLISFGYLFVTYSQTNHCVIRITFPTTGSTVPYLGSTINFNICQRLQANQLPVVFIQDPRGEWWPYISSINTPDPLRWQLDEVQYGIPSNIGRTFIIRVVLIDRRLNSNGFTFNGHTYFVQGNTSISPQLFAEILRMYPNDYSSPIDVIRK